MGSGDRRGRCAPCGNSERLRGCNPKSHAGAPLVSGNRRDDKLCQTACAAKNAPGEQNGILLCTQQSLPSSVNFEFVNKIIIPELHYNNAQMSQFYMRFVRYTSTEWKDIYF